MTPNQKNINLSIIAPIFGVTPSKVLINLSEHQRLYGINVMLSTLGSCFCK